MNIFDEGELEENLTIKDFLQAQRRIPMYMNDWSIKL